MVEELIKYDQEFLDLHAEIKRLSRKFLNKSNFILSYVSDEIAMRIKLVELLIDNMVGGYVEPFFEDEEYDESLDRFLRKTDRHGKRIILIDKIRQDKSLALEFLLRLVVGKDTYFICVIYIDFHEDMLTDIAKLLSQPEIISGVRMDAVVRHVNNKKNHVAFCFGGRDNNKKMLIQSSVDNKKKIYDVMVRHGDIYNSNYQYTSLIQRALLWGVPPQPNTEQAKAVIKHLKRL